MQLALVTQVQRKTSANFTDVKHRPLRIVFGGGGGNWSLYFHKIFYIKYLLDPGGRVEY